MHGTNVRNKYNNINWPYIFRQCHHGVGSILMEPQGSLMFHDTLQAVAGNATWISEFLPIAEGSSKHTTEVLLWLFHRLGLCCAIVGGFATYLGGKLASHPNLLTIYTAYHSQKFFFPEISVLLLIQHTPAFHLKCLYFLFEPLYSTPSDNVYYAVRYGGQAVTATCFLCRLFSTLRPAV